MFPQLAPAPDQERKEVAVPILLEVATLAEGESTTQRRARPDLLVAEVEMVSLVQVAETLEYVAVTEEELVT